MTESNQPSMDKNEARAQAAAAKAYGKSQRNWFARHKILTAIGALFIIGVIGTAAGGGSKTNTSAGDPLATTSDAATTQPTAEAPAPVATSAAPAAAAVPAKPSKPNDKGWVLESFQARNDGVGDFGGTARITNTNSEATTATFTITLARGGQQIASLQGSAQSVAAGKTVTVQLISQDKYSAGAYKSDFQTDVSFAG